MQGGGSLKTGTREAVASAALRIEEAAATPHHERMIPNRLGDLE